VLNAGIVDASQEITGAEVVDRFVVIWGYIFRRIAKFGREWVRDVDVVVEPLFRDRLVVSESQFLRALSLFPAVIVSFQTNQKNANHEHNQKHNHQTSGNLRDKSGGDCEGSRDGQRVAEQIHGGLHW
jgi:hypothetical protein